jgi:hypothetical protein
MVGIAIPKTVRITSQYKRRRKSPPLQTHTMDDCNVTTFYEFFFCNKPKSFFPFAEVSYTTGLMQTTQGCIASNKTEIHQRKTPCWKEQSGITDFRGGEEKRSVREMNINKGCCTGFMVITKCIWGILEE